MKLKNTLALSLAAVMAAGLTACGSGADTASAASPAGIPPQPRALRPPLTPPPRTATVTPPP